MNRTYLIDILSVVSCLCLPQYKIDLTEKEVCSRPVRSIQ